MVPLQSSSCLTPDPVNAGPFPSALTTMAFDHSRRRWFGVCSCKPTPRGRPSSVKQLRAYSSCELLRSWRTITGYTELWIAFANNLPYGSIRYETVAEKLFLVDVPPPQIGTNAEQSISDPGHAADLHSETDYKRSSLCAERAFRDWINGTGR